MHSLRYLVAALATAATLHAVPAFAAEVPAAMPSGKILQLAGMVRINGRPARVGTPVKKGDTLETGADSRATISLPDGSAIRLTHTTRVTLTELGMTTWLSLLKGSLLSAVHRGTSFRVNSPQVIAAVHGTVFYIESSAMKPNYACICEGSVELYSTQEKAQHRVISTKSHKAFIVDPQRFGATMLWGHTDAESKELRRLVR